MATPPKAPGSPNIGRNRALEFASPGSFPDNATGPYNPTTGTPAKDAGGTYSDSVRGIPDPGGLAGEPNPFKLGGQ